MTICFFLLLLPTCYHSIDTLFSLLQSQYTCYYECYHTITLWKIATSYRLHGFTLLPHPTAYYHTMEYQYTYCLPITCYRLHPITLWNTNIPTIYRLHATAYMLSLYGRQIHAQSTAYMLSLFREQIYCTSTAYILLHICYDSLEAKY